MYDRVFCSASGVQLLVILGQVRWSGNCGCLARRGPVTGFWFHDFWAALVDRLKILSRFRGLTGHHFAVVAALAVIIAGSAWPVVSHADEQTTCGLLKDSWLARHIDTILAENEVSPIRAVSVDGTSLVEIQADKIEFPERNVVYLTGYTKLTQDGHTISADELVYNKDQRIVEARGMVRLSAKKGDMIETTQLLYDIATRSAHADREVRLITAKGDFINTVNLHYDLDSEIVRSGAADFVFASRGANSPVHIGGERQISAYGTAKKLSLLSADIVNLSDVVVTTCLDGREDMKFTADELRVDLETGHRKAVNAHVLVIAPDQYRTLVSVMDDLD